ncbi:MAG: ATP synthase subunit I [Methanosarcina sp.]
MVLIAGILLGGFFFGGLWLTVQKGLSVRRPELWFLGSLLTRTIITVTGFYFVSDGQFTRLLLCLLGFFLARRIVLRLTREAGDEKNQLTKGAEHAT